MNVKYIKYVYNALSYYLPTSLLLNDFIKFSGKENDNIGENFTTSYELLHTNNDIPSTIKIIFHCITI